MQVDQTSALSKTLHGLWHLLLAPLPLLSILLGGGGLLLVLSDDSRGDNSMFSGLATALGIVGVVLGVMGVGATAVLLATAKRSATATIALSSLGSIGLLLLTGGFAGIPDGLRMVTVTWTLAFMAVSWTAHQWPTGQGVEGQSTRAVAPPIPPVPPTPQDALYQPPPPRPVDASATLQSVQTSPTRLSRDAARYQQLRKKRR